MKSFFDLYFSEDFGKKLDKELEKILAQRDKSLEDQASELAEHYTRVIESVAPGYHRIKIDRDDYRKIKTDEKIYDFDALISHSQKELHEHILAIDALISDAVALENDLNIILSLVENLINETNN